MKSIAKWIGASLALAVVVHVAFQVPLGWSMLGFLVGLPVAGMLVTIDDHFPGGWSNPDGRTRQMWSYGEFWGELTLRSALSLVGFAIDNGWSTPEAVPYWISAAVGIVAGVASIRTWPFPRS